MDKKVIILFPTWLEAKAFAMRHGTEYEVAKVGIGLSECASRTAKIISERKPDIVILAGIAGAYRKSGLHKGDTVFVERENSYDLGTMRGADFLPLPKDGGTSFDNYYTCPYKYNHNFRQVTSNSVNIAGFGGVNKNFEDAQIENMEGASFFGICNALDVKFAEIRVISNIVGEDRSQWLLEEAVEKLADDLIRFIDDL